MGDKEDEMPYKELYEIAERLQRPEDMLTVIHHFMNMGGDTRMKLYLEGGGRWKNEDRTHRMDRPLVGWHPTLQQCLMRGFIVPAIRVLSDDPNPDDRNRATVKLCKEILPLVDNYTIPFV